MHHMYKRTKQHGSLDPCSPERLTYNKCRCLQVLPPLLFFAVMERMDSLYPQYTAMCGNFEFSASSG